MRSTQSGTWSTRTVLRAPLWSLATASAVRPRVVVVRRRRHSNMQVICVRNTVRLPLTRDISRTGSCCHPCRIGQPHGARSRIRLPPPRPHGVVSGGGGGRTLPRGSLEGLDLQHIQFAVRWLKGAHGQLEHLVGEVIPLARVAVRPPPLSN